MRWETLSVQRDGAVLKILLDVPDRLNAVSIGMADELACAVANAEDARAILLTGSGRAFSAGADLGAPHAADISPGAACQVNMLGHYQPMMLALARSSIPIVVAVNGPAVGIGCSIALCGDIILAGRSAYFLQAFGRIGLVPDGGSSWLLPRFVGHARAMEMVLLGERVSAEQALCWGLVNRCVDDELLADEALAMAHRLASGATLALGLTRRNMLSAWEESFAETLVKEAVAQRIAAESVDAAEGGRAFMETRAPRFEGR